ncbi:MAG: hypothetical protein KAQ85_05680 [Thermodesulfovibrionia bacterium]|nr:hypothetical protein [Thermodesulfovibrionia bacterium]
MIQEDILNNLLKNIHDEKDFTTRFKLLEQLQMFSNACATLASQNIYPTNDQNSPTFKFSYRELKLGTQKLLSDLGLDFDALTKILQGGRVKFLEKDHPLPETAKWLLDAGIFDKLPNK